MIAKIIVVRSTIYINRIVKVIIYTSHKLPHKSYCRMLGVWTGLFGGGGCKKDTPLLRPYQLKRVSGIITKGSRDQTTLTVKAGSEMQEIPLTL